MEDRTPAETRPGGLPPGDLVELGPADVERLVAVLEKAGVVRRTGVSAAVSVILVRGPR